MNNDIIIPLLKLAGIGHFGILAASVQVPWILNWKDDLAKLHPFTRRLFWVYGMFIMFMIIGFGSLTLMNVQEFATGSHMARGIAAFIAIFWGMRLAVQFFVFDAGPFLTNSWRKLGYHTLTGAFVFFTALYGWAAFH